jgi:dienelactone hydrolase
LESGDIEHDIASADAFLLKQGISRVILVGQSLGGTRSLAAAARIQPPPAAAVSFSGESAPDDVRSLQVPTLIFASEDDQYFPGTIA